MNLKPIQIGRKVENAGMLLRAAALHGLIVERPERLHITLAWSRIPVDWDLEIFAPRTDRIALPAGRYRTDRFGNGAIGVLRIPCPALEARHAALIGSGASWDWDAYRPHVTLAMIGDARLPDEILIPEDIQLGPEYRKELSG